MKILQINITSNWGSTGHIVEDIGSLIKINNGCSYVAYGRYSSLSSLENIKIGNKNDIYFHILQTRIFDKHGLASTNATKKLIKQLDSIKPDIIHLHNIHGYYLNYKLLFNYLSQINIPIVWTLHDCWAYTGHCAYYTYVKCNLWKTGCHHCPQKEKYPTSWLRDRSYQNFLDKKVTFTMIENMTIVPVSNWLAKEVKESFLKKYPLKVIHNGIDLKTFHPLIVDKNKYGLKNKFIILGVASSWDKRKGLDDFIHLNHLLSSNYKIILIGLSQNQINKLPEGIIGLKRTNNIQELVEYYSVADVYINFSVEETFGMTTCESLACGTPVIVYNSTACPEIVSNGTGYITEPHDFKRIIQSIKLIEKKGKTSYQKACIERVQKLYDKKLCYSQYIELYKSLICK